MCRSTPRQPCVYSSGAGAGLRRGRQFFCAAAHRSAVLRDNRSAPRTRVSAREQESLSSTGHVDRSQNLTGARSALNIPFPRRRHRGKSGKPGDRREGRDRRHHLRPEDPSLPGGLRSWTGSSARSAWNSPRHHRGATKCSTNTLVDDLVTARSPSATPARPVAVEQIRQRGAGC